MSIATVGELLEQIEGIDPATRIRVAIQPSYPIAVGLRAVTLLEAGDDELDPDFDPNEVSTLWLATSDSVSHPESPYAPSDAWNGSSW